MADRTPVQWGRRFPCRGWWDLRCRRASYGALWCWTWCRGTVHRSRCRISRSSLLALPECPTLQTYKTQTNPHRSLRRLNPSPRRCGANLPVNNALCVKLYRNTEVALLSWLVTSNSLHTWCLKMKKLIPCSLQLFFSAIRRCIYDICNYYKRLLNNLSWVNIHHCDVCVHWECFVFSSLCKTLLI